MKQLTIQNRLSRVVATELKPAEGCGTLFDDRSAFPGPVSRSLLVRRVGMEWARQEIGRGVAGSGAEPMYGFRSV